MNNDMLQIGDKDNCCGCGACANICPYNAIQMRLADNGFYYPVLDKEFCVNCGLCVKTCDFKNFRPTGNRPSSYAARHKNLGELMTSRSGGFFMAVCKYVIDSCDGVVFGCEMEGLNAIHKYESTYQDCKKFKGSKYVQSLIGNTFVQCADFLQDGRTVLFSGTGCQVGGLIRYLETRRISLDHLITIDIICHGVPSPGVWQNYIKLLEKKENTKILKIDFRDKKVNGWADHIETYVTEDGKKLQSRSWTAVFYRHVLFRESCYNCRYATVERCSDFTIADYWGIGRNVPRFDDNKGCSLVLIHSNMGRKVFEKVKQNLDYEKTNLETSMQPQMKRPIWKGWDYSYFWKRYYRNPEKTVQLYFFPSSAMQIFWKVEKIGKKYVKRVLKLGGK